VETGWKPTHPYRAKFNNNPLCTEWQVPLPKGRAKRPHVRGRGKWSPAEGEYATMAPTRWKGTRSEQKAPPKKVTPGRDRKAQTREWKLEVSIISALGEDEKRPFRMRANKRERNKWIVLGHIHQYVSVVRSPLAAGAPITPVVALGQRVERIGEGALREAYRWHSCSTVGYVYRLASRPR